MIRSLTELSPTERMRLWRFFARFGPQPPFADVAAMERALCAPMFAGGSHYLTEWAEDGMVVGAVGVVTNEAVSKGEVYLVAPHVRPVTAAGQLVEGVYAVLRTLGLPPSLVVKLGIRQSMSHLEPDLARLGFRPVYSALEMERAIDPSAPGAAQRLWFEPVTPANVADYVAVKNAAFLRTPNGALTDDTEVLDDVARAASPEFHLVGYAADTPAVVLELTVADGVGEIDSLGVAPALWGQGFGRVGLRHALAVLRYHGATRARLQVIDANMPAVRLYQKEGFTVRRQVTSWFVGPPL